MKHVIGVPIIVGGSTLFGAGVGAGLACWFTQGMINNVHQAIYTAESLNLAVPAELLAKQHNIGVAIGVTAAVFAGIALIVSSIGYASLARD